MVAYLRQLTYRLSVRTIKNLFWLWNRPSSSPLLLTALLNGYIDHDHHVDHDDTIMIKSKKYLEKCDHHDEEHDRKLSYSKGLNVACQSMQSYYMNCTGNIKHRSIGLVGWWGHKSLWVTLSCCLWKLSFLESVNVNVWVSEWVTKAPIVLNS